MSDLKAPRLGVNIDHVATLRQQRDEGYPDIQRAADAVLKAGADQITIHLREDRRHIQDSDVALVKEFTDKYGKPLNLEIGSADSIIDYAIEMNPDWICLVPEKREEKTTEGGLDLSGDNFLKLKDTMSKLRDGINNVKISLFVEASKEVMEKSVELKADAVEIHTGSYAIDFLANKPVENHLKLYQDAFETLKGTDVHFHAGHGLTDKSVIPLLEMKLFEEYNIGHWIICESVFHSLGSVTESLQKTFSEYKFNY